MQESWPWSMKSTQERWELPGEALVTAAGESGGTFVDGAVGKTCYAGRSACPPSPAHLHFGQLTSTLASSPPGRFPGWRWHWLLLPSTSFPQPWDWLALENMKAGFKSITLKEIVFFWILVWAPKLCLPCGHQGWPLAIGKEREGKRERERKKARRQDRRRKK